jgi:hypothetical protein
MVDHAAKIIHGQIFSDGANPYRTLNSATQMREGYMTEIQGWIAIVLLLLMLVQLVMVGSEMRGLRKNFTSRIDALYQKFFGTD